MKKETIKIGYIGLGSRGSGVLSDIAGMGDVEIAVICDTDPAKLDATVKMLTEKGLPAPRTTTDYREILAMPEIDAVFVMTSWRTHIGIARDSMLAGKYTAMEVGIAYDLSECYELLDAYKQTHAPLMMLENCCYGRRELAILRLIKEGLFGEIVHCAGGYQHYLQFFRNAEGLRADHYCAWEYAARNCDLYPTHELGPIEKFLNINRGNRMLTLSSFASKARGIKSYVEDNNFPADHPLRHTEIHQGDIVNTVITCANGETILLTLDTTLPRPYYTRGISVRGTRGLCHEVKGDIATYVVNNEGIDSVYNNEAEIFEKYDHPLWSETKNLNITGGHGGMDTLVVRAFIESVKNGTQTPIDIYDTLSLLAIGPLSAASIAKGGAPVDVPDFTEGKWIRREPPVNSKYSLDLIVNDPETPICPAR